MTTSDRLIYIGPTLSGKRVLQYRVFIGGLPAEVQGIIAAHPWFSRLFVSLENLNEKKAECTKKGTPLYLYYQKAMEV